MCNIKSKFRIGDKVTLIPTHKFRLQRMFQRQLTVTKGLVCLIEVVPNIGVITHIFSEKGTAFYNQDFLKKQNSWMKGFSLEGKPMDDLALSQAEAKRYIADKAKQGKNIGRIK